MEKSRDFVLRKRRNYSEIGAVFGIVPRLQFWAIWPAHTLRMALIILGLPSDGANGPSDLGPSDSQVGAIHRAFLGEWTRGAR